MTKLGLALLLISGIALGNANRFTCNSTSETGPKYDVAFISGGFGGQPSLIIEEDGKNVLEVATPRGRLPVNPGGAEKPVIPQGVIQVRPTNFPGVPQVIKSPMGTIATITDPRAALFDGSVIHYSAIIPDVRLGTAPVYKFKTGLVITTDLAPQALKNPNTPAVLQSNLLVTIECSASQVEFLTGAQP